MLDQQIQTSAETIRRACTVSDLFFKIRSKEGRGKEENEREREGGRKRREREREREGTEGRERGRERVRETEEHEAAWKGIVKQKCFPNCPNHSTKSPCEYMCSLSLLADAFSFNSKSITAHAL